MKILVIGDLHGRIPRNLSKECEFIVCVGDFCEDRNIAKYTKLWTQYLKKANSGKNEKRMGWDEFIISKLGEGGFEELLEESELGGREILEFLNSINKPIFVVPGNWDNSYGWTRIKNMRGSFNHKKSFLDFYLNSNGMNKVLIDGLENVSDCMYKLIETKKFNIIGYGLSSGPEKVDAKNMGRLGEKKINILKDTEKKILNKLLDEYNKRNKDKITIFLSHNTPFGTSLDIITDEKSYVFGEHLGSTIAREFCEKTQVPLCLSGHIHEHFGEDRIGKTRVVNAGFGEKNNVIIEINEKNQINIEFVSGK